MWLFVLFPELLYLAIMMLCGTVAGVNFATFVSDHPVGVTVSYGIIAVLLVLRSLASETDTANDRMFAVTMAIFRSALR